MQHLQTLTPSIIATLMLVRLLLLLLLATMAKMVMTWVTQHPGVVAACL